MNEKFSAIVFIILGLFLFACFYLLKKKHKINIMHDFVYKNISKKKLNRFSEEMSMVFLFLSIGTITMGLSYFFNFVTVGSVILVLGIVLSALTYRKLQVKYKFSRARK